jgi:hypothetical protein
VGKTSQVKGLNNGVDAAGGANSQKTNRFALFVFEAYGFGIALNGEKGGMAKMTL